MKYINNPKEIEDKSFEIITRELGGKIFPNGTDSIIKRVIHTTADFEYGEITEISPEFIETFQKLILEGSDIYCDTEMIKSGLNKSALSNLNTSVYTLINDEKVKKEAQEFGITRSIAGVKKALQRENTKIFVIGNAPTALFTICETVTNEKVKNIAVVGVPVGFVGAAESKEELKKTNIPYIVTNGRKGGSTVAVSIVNALLYQLTKRHENN